MEYILPTSNWINSLNIGDSVLLISTAKVGAEPIIKEVKIKSISQTGIMKLEGSSYSFKDGYRRGFQYSGNCWTQPIK